MAHIDCPACKNKQISALRGGLDHLQIIRSVFVVIAGILLTSCQGAPAPVVPDLGHIEIVPTAKIQTDQETLSQIVTTFNLANDALRRQDLDSVMNLYSKNYKYHGIDKTELRNIWEDLFTLYRDFSSTHLFSSITADTTRQQPTAEITCTGSLWAFSRLTGRRVNIDSWWGEVHYLVLEDGLWRIQGHAWEERDTRFWLTPHPFF
jgi:hypothetical protein